MVEGVTQVTQWVIVGYRLPITRVEGIVTPYVLGTYILFMLIVGVEGVDTKMPPLLSRQGGGEYSGCNDWAGLVAQED